MWEGIKKYKQKKIKTRKEINKTIREQSSVSIVAAANGCLPLPLPW
jgi:hypothetical protein